MKPLSTVQARWGYIVLFFFALLIPVVHNREVNRALEHTRLTEGLMPANYLMLKWLGQLAIVAPIVFFTLYVLSWFRKEINSTSVLAVTSIAYPICVTLYACYSSLQLALWLQGF